VNYFGFRDDAPNGGDQSIARSVEGFSSAASAAKYEGLTREARIVCRVFPGGLSFERAQRAADAGHDPVPGPRHLLRIDKVNAMDGAAFAACEVAAAVEHCPLPLTGDSEKGPRYALVVERRARHAQILSEIARRGVAVGVPERVDRQRGAPVGAVEALASSLLRCARRLGEDAGGFGSEVLHLEVLPVETLPCASRHLRVSAGQHREHDEAKDQRRGNRHSRAAKFCQCAHPVIVSFTAHALRAVRGLVVTG
jgi:hypothetical protein